MPSTQPEITGPFISGVPVSGGVCPQARWTVHWPETVRRATFGAATSALATWASDLGLTPLTGASPPSMLRLLNEMIVRLALRLHARVGPDYHQFIASAPSGANESGFSLCFLDLSMATMAADWSANAVSELLSDAAPARSIDTVAQAGIEALAPLWPSKDTARVLLAAWRRGIPITRITDVVPAYRLGHGHRQAKLYKSFTHRTPFLAVVLSGSKLAASQTLARLGFPVPDNQFVRSFDEARAWAARVGYPVVIKPNTTDYGRGVTADIRSERQLAAAFERARALGDVLIEQHVAGENYRLFVIDGVCRGVNHRIQPHVIGDGIHSIVDLMRQRARDPRAGGPFPDPSDPVVAGFLEERGRSFSEVPPVGERILVSAVANASAGGTRLAVTEIVHPDTKRLAERVALALDIDVAGIDLITSDITRPWHAVGAKINEVNVNPGLPSPEAPDWVLDSLFPGRSNGRIEIQVIVGEVSSADAAVVSAWSTRGQPNRARAAILGPPSASGAGRQPPDASVARRAVERLLGSCELASIVVQAAKPDSRGLAFPVPYCARILVSGSPAEQAGIMERVRAYLGPNYPVVPFDGREFLLD